jgi:hypothetical protein
MVKVRPLDLPGPGVSPLLLRAARNEFVSFQVVINGGDSGVTGVSASAGMLGDPRPILDADFALYRVGYVQTVHTSFPGTPTGLWPDALVPDVDDVAGEKRNAFPFDVPANQSRSVWVDIHVPAGLTSGTYAGTVHVTGAGLDTTLPFSLEVVAADLPSTSSLPSAFLAFSGNVCLAHTGTGDCGGTAAAAQLMARYERLALEHHITLSNLFLVTNQGNDWTAFDAAYAPFLDGTAPSRLVGVQMTSAQFPGVKSAPRYLAYANHFRARGWYDRFFDYTGDEPGYNISFADLTNRLALAKGAVPDLRTLVTMSIQVAQSSGLTSLVDVLCPVINQLEGVDAPYLGDQRPTYDAFLAQPGKRLWSYQSCMSQGCGSSVVPQGAGPGEGWPSYLLDATASKNRAMQWLLFVDRVQGELYYETVLSLPTAFTDQFQYNGNGDGNLFYPGNVANIGGSTEVPLPSIRLKLIRQGMQDYEWLKLVSDAGDPQFAHDVARALLPAASRVGPDGSAFERARSTLIDRYLQLRPPPNTNFPPASGGTSATVSAGSGNSTPPPATVHTKVLGSCQTIPGVEPAAAIALFVLAVRASRRRRQIKAANERDVV